MTAPSLAIASAALRAPFPPGVEQYRVGPTWESEGTRWTRPLAYIDARTVFARLDEAVGPDNWSSDIERLGVGVYVCRLTVCGVMRADVGQAGDNEGEKEKSGVSDAIKRAAVSFGLGAYLYERDLPPVKLERRSNNDWGLPKGWRPSLTAGATQPQSTRPAATSPAPTSAHSPVVARRMATAAQIRKIEAEAAWRGLTDEDLDHQLQGRLLTDLTCTEASRAIEQLIALAPRRREVG